jgi:hypothetical protein
MEYSISMVSVYLMALLAIATREGRDPVELGGEREQGMYVHLMAC